MHRTILGGLVLVATAACGAQSRLGTYGHPDDGDVLTPSAGQAWATTYDRLEHLKSADFSATLANQRCSKASTTDCQLTTQTIHSNGTFSLKPASVESTVQISVPATENAGKGDTTVQMRELTNGALYSRETSDPGSCWITWAKGYKPTFEAGFRTGLKVLRSAEVDYDLPLTGSGAELAAKANALAVVRTLGLAPTFDATYGITPAVRKELASKTVALQLKIGADGSSVSFVVDGRQVATEIDPGGSAGTTAYLATVQRSSFAFIVRNFDKAAQVAAPASNQVLPQGAPTGSSCG